MALPIKKLELSFSTMEFYESMVISTIKEDMIIERDHVDQLRDICIEHFREKEFVYIANRKYNYNVNPIIYIDLVKTFTLKGIAVVSDNIDRLKTANFEKNFSPVPYELFQKKEEAIVWAKEIPTI